MSSHSELFKQARGQWPYLLEAAGIDPSYLKNKHGPCPICGGKDRFRFDNKEEQGTYICNQCGAGNGYQLLRIFLNVPSHDVDNFLERQLNGGPVHIKTILKKNHLLKTNTSKQENSEIKKEKLKLVWSQTQSITTEDPVAVYLQKRGIKLQSWPESLRYHPNLPYYDNGKMIGEFPAMIALVQDQYNEITTLHRTYLGDGCKANVLKPKKLMAPIIKGSVLGSAVRLYPVNNDKTLILAEGIETALALYAATKASVWATVSALGMERIILPSDISTVIIATDNDHSGTGQKAAAKLASRLLSEGKTVKCVMPPRIGDDFADLLLEDK